MKAKVQGSDPLLTQACIVPRWTTTSPVFRCTSCRRRARDRIRPTAGSRIDRLVRLHEFGRAGTNSVIRTTLPGPSDIIVAHDEAFFCAAAAASELSTGIVSVDQISQRAM